jgi:hypothetical protein
MRLEDLEQLPMATRIVERKNGVDYFIEKEYGSKGNVLVRVSVCPTNRHVKVGSMEEIATFLQ